MNCHIILASQLKKFTAIYIGNIAANHTEVPLTIMTNLVSSKAIKIPPKIQTKPSNIKYNNTNKQVVLAYSSNIII